MYICDLTIQRKIKTLTSQISLDVLACMLMCLFSCYPLRATKFLRRLITEMLACIFSCIFCAPLQRSEIFCALTCGLSSRWRGNVCFQFSPFYPPLIGFIGLIDTFPQKCGQNRPKLGVNQISPLTSIDSGKALWKFLAGQPCGKQRGLHVRYTCYPSV